MFDQVTTTACIVKFTCVKQIKSKKSVNSGLLTPHGDFSFYTRIFTESLPELLSLLFLFLRVVERTKNALGHTFDEYEKAQAMPVPLAVRYEIVAPLDDTYQYATVT